jgi:hypothetical protein
LDEAFHIWKVGEAEGNFGLVWGEEDAILAEVKLGDESSFGEVGEEAIAIFPEGMSVSLGVIVPEMIRA